MNKAALEQRNSERTKGVLFVTWVALWLNLFLTAGKISIGWLTNSSAVVADGVHSLSDLVTDLVIILGAKVWASPADSNHPYGHQRLESLISLIIGVILGFAGLGIAYDAVMGMFTPRPQAVGSLLTLAIILVSIVSKECIYHWTKHKAIELKSSAVEANAWDHRSDAISSIPVAIAVIVSLWKPEYAAVDLWGALIVSVFILYAAWNICRPAINTLLDQGAEAQTHNKIMTFVLSQPGVKGVHRLRSRYLGQALSLDMHVQVDGQLTIVEANAMAHQLEHTLYSDIATKQIGLEVCDVVLHLDPWLRDEKYIELSDQENH